MLMASSTASCAACPPVLPTPGRGVAVAHTITLRPRVTTTSARLHFLTGPALLPPTVCGPGDVHSSEMSPGGTAMLTRHGVTLHPRATLPVGDHVVTSWEAGAAPGCHWCRQDVRTGFTEKLPPVLAFTVDGRRSGGEGEPLAGTLGGGTGFTVR